MIEYWLQNGDAYLLENNLKPEDISLEFQIRDPPEQIRDILEPLLQNNGKATIFFNSYFKQLTRKTRFKESKTKTCSICGNKGADKIKGWIFPFIIDKNKFPNLYPHGKIESLNLCRNCAVRSFAAYHNVYFTAQRDYISFVIFYSDTPKDLNEFLKTYAPKRVSREYYYNWRAPDVVFFPHEYLATILNEISEKIKIEAELFEKRTGALIFGVSVRGNKKIFEFAEVLSNLSEFINIFLVFKNKYPRNPFYQLFRGLRKDGEVKPDLFIWRNLFFKKLFKYRDIDWNIVENILFYNIRERNQTPPFLHPFLLSVMEVLRMGDKELYEKASTLGYRLGMETLRKELGKKIEEASKDEIDRARKKLVQRIYELKRKRTLEEFLDSLNTLQLSAESEIDDRPFRENEKIFYKLKVFFLIGISNAAFSKMKEKGGDRNES